MGSTTKTASEKNGTWTFSSLDIGTWTITATKGSSIATQDVNITRLTVEYVTIDTLSFDGTLSTAMTNFADAACLCIWTSLGTYVTDNRVAYINFKTASPKQIDVSALTGTHRVGFFLFSNGTYAKVNSLLIE